MTKNQNQASSTVLLAMNVDLNKSDFSCLSISNHFTYINAFTYIHKGQDKKAVVCRKDANFKELELAEEFS